MGARRLEAGLLEWMRCREGRHLEAAVRQTRHRWKSAQFKFQKMRPHDLASDADIRKAGLNPQYKRSRRPACEQPLIGRKTLSRPMLAPTLDCVHIGAKHLGGGLAPRSRHRRGPLHPEARAASWAEYRRDIR